MFYTTKYHFEVNQPLSEVDTQLRAAFLRDFDVKSDGLIEKSDAFVGTYNYDEFVLSQRARPFERTSITPDAHIKLTKIDDTTTQVKVTIKLSDIWKFFIVIFHLIAVAVTLFVDNFRVFGHNVEGSIILRILAFSTLLIILNGIVWISFSSQRSIYKRIIREHFLVDWK